MRDRRGRLKGDPKVNLFAIADPTLHTARIVGCCANFPAAHFKWIIVLGTAHARGPKPGTDLESFGCRQTHHRLRQVRLELIKNRFAEPGWNPANNTFNHATH